MLRSPLPNAQTSHSCPCQNSFFIVGVAAIVCDLDFDAIVPAIVYGHVSDAVENSIDCDPRIDPLQSPPFPLSSYH
ncbi:hypothetical protein SUGI_0595890 [Cryptomeria japonica]|nr:hypothetical protein SUGI_0595890 [Cryptomeria japonica]